MTWTVHTGDCRDVLATLAESSVDTVICDPPYGLTFMGKEWDQQVPGPDYWRAVLRVAKPGAMLLAFGGTRTFHRLTSAIEDAGWEVRDCLSWLYGSGFPKSMDIAKAIDKAAGATREVVGPGKYAGRESSTDLGRMNDDAWKGGAARTETAPATADARLWHGWGTALKPAYEPIIVACKPHPVHLSNIAKEIACLMDALSARMGTSSCESLHAAGFWSTAQSLRESLDVLSALGSKCTIETASSLTTDLRILKSSLSANTRDTTTQDLTAVGGTTSSAHLAAAISRSVQAKCARLAPTTAGEIAIDWRADEANDLAAGRIAPAWEPIILAMKPLDGTFADNAQRHGVAGLAIDAGRIEAEHGWQEWVQKKARPNSAGAEHVGDVMNRPKAPTVNVHAAGRWPANVLLDEVAAAALDEQSGELHGRGNVAPTTRSGGKGMAYGEFGAVTNDEDHWHDSAGGGASRFFKVCKFTPEDLCEHASTAPISSSPPSHAGASAQSDAAISDALVAASSPASLAPSTSATQSASRNGCASSTPPIRPSASRCSPESAVERETQRPYPASNAERSEPIGTTTTTASPTPFASSAVAATSATTEPSVALGVAGSRFIYSAKASRSERGAGNDHPTVKPVELMRYLCRLTRTPSGGVVLDPFAGSGTTGVAALLEDREFIGIELDQHSADIARRRCAEADPIGRQVSLLDVLGAT